MDIKNINIPRWDYKSIVIWTILLLAGFKFLTIGISHETLWYDESYSAAIINHSIPQIWSIVSSDSHPPLYFIMLKIFSMIFGRTEASLRLLSVLGILAIAALGAGPVRRISGKFTGMIYTFIVIVVPISLSVGQDTRMYTWAAFFVTSAVLYGYLAVEEGKLSDFVKMGVSSLAAAYTHYYALMAVTIANAIIFIWLIVKLIVKRDKKNKLIIYMGTAVVAVLSYAPWIVSLLGQASKVSKDFWIPEVTSQVIWRGLIFPFSAKFLTMPTSDASFIGAVLLILWGFGAAVVKRSKEALMPLMAILVFSLTLVGGIIISNLIRPMFIERYMFPVSGLFLLALAYGISQLKSKTAAKVTCGVLLIVSLPLIGTIATERFNGPMKEVTQHVNKSIKPDHVFIHTDEHTFGVFSYYYPDHKHFLYLKPGFKGYSGYAAFAPNGVTGSDIDKFIKDSKNIWLVSREGFGAPPPPFEWFMSGKLKSNEQTERFKTRYSFFAVSVRRVYAGGVNKEPLEGKGTIRFNLFGLDGRKGPIYVKLFNKDISFFDEKGIAENNVFMTRKVEGEGIITSKVVFDDLPYGAYAAFVYHDLNNNGKLDTREDGFPKEGVGISNGFGSGDPNFNDASFILDFKEVEKDIGLFYP